MVLTNKNKKHFIMITCKTKIFTLTGIIQNSPRSYSYSNYIIAIAIMQEKWLGIIYSAAVNIGMHVSSHLKYLFL